jgi:(p)ppGpp synthase/HD superfamily hydrolase
MNHTPQIKKAIQFAARKHNGQMRRETEPLPYITHPFSVALLVAEDGADDDVITAALLHDVIEDTGTQREEIAAVFNERVATLVEAVSEPKDLEWRARKEAYFNNLQTAPVEALLVMAADKIDNIESKIEAYEKEGDALLARWQRPASDYLWYHGEALRLALARIPGHILTNRLAEAHEREKQVFGT